MCTDGHRPMPGQTTEPRWVCVLSGRDRQTRPRTRAPDLFRLNLRNVPILRAGDRRTTAATSTTSSHHPEGCRNPIIEHLTGWVGTIRRCPPFTAVPPAVRALDTFAVRAFATFPGWAVTPKVTTGLLSLSPIRLGTSPGAARNLRKAYGRHQGRCARAGGRALNTSICY